METIYICVLTLLGVFALMLWLVFHFNRAQRDLEAELRSLKQSQDGIRARNAQLVEAQKKLGEAMEAKPKPRPEPELDAEAEAPARTTEAKLTVAAVSGCLRAAGFIPKTRESTLTFMKEDESYSIDMSRNPRLFISKSYLVSSADWDLELLQRAAHQMSDDIMMIKADISDPLDEEGNRALRFYIAMMERTVRGFRENLSDYISILDDGHHRMGEIYEELEKEKKEAASLNGLANSSFNQNGKTPS